MNIFVLDENPTLAAQFQCDKHVVKMILESAQILSTVQSKYGIETKYKPTHSNHPCTLWAGESLENYLWMLQHAIALCREYTKRYGKKHASEEVIQIAHTVPVSFDKHYLTPFAQAMPDKYKQEDAVQAYREYYICEKGHFAKWKLGNVPYWWIQL